LSHAAHSLYLFLATVADHQGLSWYSDGRVMVELGMNWTELETARRELLGADLVAYRPPLYQVLELAPAVGVVTCVGRVTGGPAERPATPAEVHALIQAAFGPVGR
jgi:hypothetical protein